MKLRKCDICGSTQHDDGFTYEPNMGYKIKIKDLSDHWDTDKDTEKFYICGPCGMRIQKLLRKELKNLENARYSTGSSSNVSGTDVEGTGVKDAGSTGVCDLEEKPEKYVDILAKLAKIVNSGTEAKEGDVRSDDDLGLDDNLRTKLIRYLAREDRES